MSLTLRVGVETCSLEQATCCISKIATDGAKQDGGDLTELVIPLPDTLPIVESLIQVDRLLACR